MPIPFEHSDVDDFNALNQCCCPEQACHYAGITFEHRDHKDCTNGWWPYIKNETRPDGFDYTTTGSLIPLYKKRKTSERYEIESSISTTYKYYQLGGSPEIQKTYEWNGTHSYDFTTSTTEEYGIDYNDLPASGWPMGNCPPESGLSASATTPSGITLGSDLPDNKKEVKLTTSDVRPDDPSGATEDDGEGGEVPVKVGYYEWLIDRTTTEYSDLPELDLEFDADDATCHEFIVRFILDGSTGVWSTPYVFSVVSNPCCVDPEKVFCKGFLTGNEQISGSAEYFANWGSRTWTSELTDHTGGGGGSSQSGTASVCPGGDPPPSNVPAEVGSLSYGFYDSSGGTDTTVSTKNDTIQEKLVRHQNSTVSVSHDTPWEGADPETANGWYFTAQTNTYSWKKTNTTKELSEDQNTGSTGVDSLFGTVTSEMSSWDDSYGWGLTISTPWAFPSASSARAIGGYPETHTGYSFLWFLPIGNIVVQARQIRYKWTVAESHVGTAYTVKWRIGKFHDRWLLWRAEYYQWAVDKYEFLNKPEPGDDDYPVLADFDGDAGALAAAIAEIDAIEDPGAAPAEPESLRPTVATDSLEWGWASSQGVQAEEAISDCDPTKPSRILVEPQEADFADPEDFADAMAAYTAAVELREETSKRESAWYLISPDSWSDYKPKPPDVPDLPTEPPPDPEDIEEHERKIALHAYLEDKFNTLNHSALYVCDVRHICVNDPTNGTIENWDRNFHTTELPPLDPAEEDPSRWADWYSSGN